MHEAITIVIGKVYWIGRCYRTESLFNRYNKIDIEEIMTQRKYLKGDIERVLESWDNKDKDVESMFESLEEQYYTIEANTAFNEANNALIASQLYISNSTYKTINDLLGKIHQLLIMYNLNTWGDYRVNKDNELRPQIEDLQKQIVIVMRNELSHGYFQDEHNQ